MSNVGLRHILLKTAETSPENTNCLKGDIYQILKKLMAKKKFLAQNEQNIKGEEKYVSFKTDTGKLIIVVYRCRKIFFTPNIMKLT